MNLANLQLVAAYTLNNDFGISWVNLANIFGVARSTLSKRNASLIEFGYKGKPRKFLTKEDILNPDLLTAGEIGNLRTGETFVCLGYKDSARTMAIVLVDEDGIPELSSLALTSKFLLAPVKKTRAKKEVVTEEPTGKKTKSRAKKAAAVEETPEDTKPATEAPKWMSTNHNLTVIRNGKPHIIDKAHKHFEDIKKAMTAADYERAYALMDLRTALRHFSLGRVKIENDKVYFDGKIVEGKIAARMLKMLMEGQEAGVSSFAKFMEKCDANPSFRVVTRLYDFLQANDVEIDEDGDVIAWKVVRADYLDKHSGTMLNKPGMTVEMKRNEVNDKDEETCSSGLHVCSRSYIKHFSGGGDRLVRVKISPTDWVSVPTDYNNAKARVCKYQVLDDVTNKSV